MAVSKVSSLMVDPAHKRFRGDGLILMRILSVHNKYLIRGGEDESRECEEALLRMQGHHVDEYVVDNHIVSEIGVARTALRAVWSTVSFRQIRERLHHGQYDLMYVNNFFPLISPSAFYAARAEKVPVVFTIRNYRLICPGAFLFRNGKVCEECVSRRVPLPGIRYGCYRGSRTGSAAVAAMVTIHRIIGTWTHMVDVMVAVSEFARQKLIQGGIPADKIVVKPNFVSPDPGVGTHRGGYALFVGRLSPEKGVRVILEAWRNLKGLPLKIVGDGPLRPELEALARKYNLDECVEFVGSRPRAVVMEIMKEAYIHLFPSEWYETFGRVAIEAFATGLPVIASNLGAVAEVVEDGRTGLHFQPGDPEDLAAKVQWAFDHPEQIERMGLEARREYLQKYTAEQNYERMMAIFELAVRRARERQ